MDRHFAITKPNSVNPLAADIEIAQIYYKLFKDGDYYLACYQLYDELLNDWVDANIEALTETQMATIEAQIEDDIAGNFRTNEDDELEAV